MFFLKERHFAIHNETEADLLTLSPSPPSPARLELHPRGGAMKTTALRSICLAVLGLAIGLILPPAAKGEQSAPTFRNPLLRYHLLGDLEARLPDFEAYAVMLGLQPKRTYQGDLILCAVYKAFAAKVKFQDGQGQITPTDWQRHAAYVAMFGRGSEQARRERDLQKKDETSKERGRTPDLPDWWTDSLDQEIPEIWECDTIDLIRIQHMPDRRAQSNEEYLEEQLKEHEETMTQIRGLAYIFIGLLHLHYLSPAYFDSLDFVSGFFIHIPATFFLNKDQVPLAVSYKSIAAHQLYVKKVKSHALKNTWILLMSQFWAGIIIYYEQWSNCWNNHP